MLKVRHDARGFADLLREQRLTAVPESCIRQAIVPHTAHRGFGFGVQAVPGPDGGLYVSSDDCHIECRKGALYPGDRILCIDGKDASHLARGWSNLAFIVNVLVGWGSDVISYT